MEFITESTGRGRTIGVHKRLQRKLVKRLNWKDGADEEIPKILVFFTQIWYFNEAGAREIDVF